MISSAMHIESVAAGNSLSGEIHAVLDHPFTRMSSALREPAAWCDVLILPFNTKLAAPAPPQVARRCWPSELAGSLTSLERCLPTGLSLAARGRGAPITLRHA